MRKKSKEIDKPVLIVDTIKQTKKQSFFEALMNVLSGMVLAYIISQLAVFSAPWIQKHIWSGFIWDITPGSNIIMTLVLTVVSVSRSYTWRRYFNKKL